MKPTENNGTINQDTVDLVKHQLEELMRHAKAGIQELDSESDEDRQDYLNNVTHAAWRLRSILNLN